MARIGQADAALLTAPRRAWAWALVAVVATAPLAIWMRGFLIDDAFISIRYARHLAAGQGYRFNVGGPVTDGVTPLPWPFVLALFARCPSLVVLARAKLLGGLCWAATVLLWGAAVGKAQARAEAKVAAIAALAMCLPTAAHAVSGMETSLAMLAATVAAIVPGAWLACACAGLAASLRPEMIVWSAALAMTVGPMPRAVPRILVAAAPFAACACIRFVAFGRLAPLAVLAKPSDLAHGATYAAAAAIVSLAPIVALAPAALLRARGRSAALALAGLAHFAAILAVGGDWMPYARLAAPVVPSLLYAFVLASPHMSRALAGLRVVLAIVVAAYVLRVAAPAGRHVTENVASLVERAGPALLNVRTLAALDVGWPTAATEATIVDLAGLTDPEIAALPGGHTSKRIDAPLLLERNPDALLFYARKQGTEIVYSRVVEARLAASELLMRKYEPDTFLPYGNDGYGYVVFRRKASN